MSSDLSTDTGHPPFLECSQNQYNNSVFAIFGLISCVKSVLKKTKDKKIKKFYWSEGMSTMSSVSSILKNRFSKLFMNSITVMNNFYKNNRNNNHGKEKKVRVIE
jgi:hypothetical protein